jgi:phosphoglycolate phosphatase-like HAD superfamily hydrolase
VSAIIIDLDGTLCDVSHRTHFVKQSPPNWPAFFDACVDDTPNPAVVALYHMATQVNYRILFVSGRPETHRTQTEDWLWKHELGNYAELLMRAAGDYRQDAVVKRELYEAHIAGRYAVLFTVDDRDQVVAMWRDLGLVCFQVAEGNF